MRAPSSRTRKIAALAAGPMAVLAAGAMVWQGSNAAFTANTSSEANNWATGEIVLTDNDAGAASFAVTGLAPGNTGSKCITVTAKSTLERATTTIHASVAEVQNDTESTKDFSDHLKLTMQQGTFTPDQCADGLSTSGTVTSTVFSSEALPKLSADTATLAKAAGQGPASGSSVTPAEVQVQYKITYKFDTTGLDRAAENALMNKSTGADIVWELRSVTPTV